MRKVPQKLYKWIGFDGTSNKKLSRQANAAKRSLRRLTKHEIKLKKVLFQTLAYVK